MSVTISVTLSNAQAEAILRSEGFSNGHGIRRSKSLRQGEAKILYAIEDAYNANLD